MIPRYKPRTEPASQRILSPDIAHSLARIENHPRLSLDEFKRLRAEYLDVLRAEQEGVTDGTL